MKWIVASQPACIVHRALWPPAATPNRLLLPCHVSCPAQMCAAEPAVPGLGLACMHAGSLVAPSRSHKQQAAAARPPARWHACMLPRWLGPLVAEGAAVGCVLSPPNCRMQRDCMSSMSTASQGSSSGSGLLACPACKPYLVVPGDAYVVGSTVHGH
jgi:hypothetical protein